MICELDFNFITDWGGVDSIKCERSWLYYVRAEFTLYLVWAELTLYLMWVELTVLCVGGVDSYVWAELTLYLVWVEFTIMCGLSYLCITCWRSWLCIMLKDNSGVLNIEPPFWFV